MLREIFFRFPDTVTGMIAMIVLLLAESVFILFLSALDILPGKFMVAVIILLLIADVAVLLLINRKRRRRSVPAGGLIADGHTSDNYESCRVLSLQYI